MKLTYLPLPTEYVKICEEIKMRKENKKKLFPQGCKITSWPLIDEDSVVVVPVPLPEAVPVVGNFLYFSLMDHDGCVHHSKADLRQIKTTLQEATPALPYTLYEDSESSDCEFVVGFEIWKRHVFITSISLNPKKSAGGEYDDTLSDGLSSLQGHHRLEEEEDDWDL